MGNVNLKNVICNLVLAFFAAVIFCGCASVSRETALDRNKGNLARLSKPIGIFTLDTTNAYKPSYWPHVESIACVSSSSHKKKTFIVSKENFLRELSKENYRQGTGFLVSVDLDPGDYSLGIVFGITETAWGRGVFCFPVNARFTLTNGITYLGHVMMTNRRRTEPAEEASGYSWPLVPLIPQAMCGYSDGTFDVTVTDKGDSDIREFVNVYPLLKDVNITKAIMQK